HFADEAEALCGRIAVMNRGRLVADGTPDGLIAAHGGGVGVRFSLPDADSAELRSIPGVEHVTLSRDDVEVRGDRSMLAHLGAHLVSLGGSPPELRVTEPTLEDALMQIVQASDTTPASTAARHHPLEAR
ncbi:MAG: ABC transporter ATP-binding protein, partial [Actinomycetota bacterium]